MFNHTHIVTGKGLSSCITICILTLCHSFALAQNIVEVGGILNEDQLWTKDNEYHVVSDLTVTSPAVLTIQAGTKVKFNQNRQLVVEGGGLIAEGTSEDSIIFMANRETNNSWYWNGITINAVNSAGTISIQYATVKDALIAIHSISSNYLQIRHSLITDNRNKGINLFNSSLNQITDNLIVNNNVGLEIYALGVGNQSSENRIERNTFRNTGTNLLIQNLNEGITSENNISENIISEAFYGIYLYEINAAGSSGLNRVSRNIVSYNGNDSDGYGIYVSMNLTIIESNIFWQNTNAIQLESVNSRIYQNSIYDNLNGITITDNALNTSFEDNTLSETDEHLALISSVSGLSFDQNNLFSQDGTDNLVRVTTESDADLKQNYWGTLNETIIDQIIYDKKDDPQLGEIQYRPFLTTANVLAPVSPPGQPVLQQVDEGYRVTWQKNPESDVSAYLLYQGRFEEYAFDQAPLLVFDTVVFLDSYDTSERIAVTGIDDNYVGIQDQLSGHESPFAFARLFPYAGDDLAICADVIGFQITGSTVPQGSDSLAWTSSGDGYFDDQFQPQPYYFFGDSDIENGSVLLRLTVHNSGSETTDSFTITLVNLPEASAGGEAVMDADSVYLTSPASASNYDSLQWSTLGDGDFTMSDSLFTVYIPGPEDIANGNAQLLLTAYSTVCGTVTDTLKLTIFRSYTLSGKVWSGDETVPDHPVIALPSTRLNSFEFSQLVFTDIEGSFEFPKLIEGAYLIYTPADTLDNDQWLHRYYAGRTNWEDARSITLAGPVFDIDLNINSTYQKLPEGRGSLSGHFVLPDPLPDGFEAYCQPWFGDHGETYCMEGLPNISILLFGDSQSRVHGYTLTDASGNFSFQNLPYGNYFIKAELAGYQSTGSELLTLSQQLEEINDIEIVIETEKKISIHKPDNLPLSAYRAYPNPVGNYLTLELFQKSEQAHGEMILLKPTGEMVMNRKLSFEDGIVVVDVNDINSGLYIAHLIHGENTYHFMIIKN